MNFEIIIGLLTNMLMLFGLNVLYEFGYGNMRFRKKLNPMLVGLFIGAIGLVIMSNPIEITIGLFFDTRSVLVGVTALQFGFAPTMITVIILAAYRFLVGGVGMIAGIMVLLTVAAIGLLWRKFQFSHNFRTSWISGYAFGVIIHVDMMLCMLILPYPHNLDVIQKVALPIMLIFPVATFLLNEMLMLQKKRIAAHIQTNDNMDKYRVLFENDHVVMLVIDPDTGKILDANPAAAQYYGWTEQELKEMNISEINMFSPTEIREEMQRSVREGKHCYLFQHRLKDGSIRDVEVSGGPVKIKGKVELHSIIIDVSARISAENNLIISERRLRSVVDNAPEGILIQTGYVIRYINQIACDFFGADSPDLLVNTSIFERAHPDLHEKIRLRGERLISNTGSVPDYESTFVRLDGSTFDAEVRAVSFTFENEPGIMVFFRDITERKEKEQRILQLSYHDELTGVYNRRYYEEEIKRLDKASNLPIAIVMCDVNAMKLVNDSFGHDQGDELLKSVAKAMREEFSDGCTIARLDGDEFAVICPQTDMYMAEKILERVQDRLSVQKIGPLEISAAFGCALMVNEKETFQDIFKEAEDRMYKNKVLESHSIRGKSIDLIMNSLYEKNNREQLHSSRVSDLCASLATSMGFSHSEIARCKMAGLVHDIGKIGINDSILNKEGTLTEGEWCEVKQHAEIGYRILNSISEFAEFAIVILEHHERWDGAGYPRGLKGDEISLSARMIAVADTYDAMTSDRTYRSTRTSKEATDEIIRLAGSQFDPEITHEFIKMLHSPEAHCF